MLNLCMKVGFYSNALMLLQFDMRANFILANLALSYKAETHSTIHGGFVIG